MPSRLEPLGAFSLASPICFLVCFITGSAAGAQPTSAEDIPTVDFCEVAGAPARFAGQVVRIRATVLSGFEAFALMSSECDYRIWLELVGLHTTSMIGGAHVPDGRVIPEVDATDYLECMATGALRDPTELPWQEIHPPPLPPVVHDKVWKDFAKKVAKQKRQPWGVKCFYCPKYSVTATFIGRLDFLSQGYMSLNAQGKVGYTFAGFGHMNRYPSRLLVAQVESFEAAPVPEVRP